MAIAHRAHVVATISQSAQINLTLSALLAVEV
jgi:hypothetical protein